MEIFHAMQQLHLKNNNNKKKHIKNVLIIEWERVQYEIYLLSFDSIIRKIPGVATKHFQI